MSEATSPQLEDGAPPRHVAIIMDGNHRWARWRHLPGSAGHRAGARAVRPVAERAAELGVEVLTLFAFSTENWFRPRREVSLLMALMRRVLTEDVHELHRERVRVQIIGDRSRFSEDLQKLMADAEALTAQNMRMTLMIAANYGGRWDIVNAARALAQEVEAGRLRAQDIDESALDGALSLAGVPPPDLCIRTGGDHRISNFLLWQFAYTELFFTDRFWPDFDGAALEEALVEFYCRQRRFGRR
ncbi:MAG: di-trans,poly-cis-decaprenylcistransferase [Pseudomonadales bacterium]|nr:di-trans,poly-cis-decaprenylcistransferase [Pseudomonadales bacterium]